MKEQSILYKGVMSIPLPAYQVVNAKTPEQPIQTNSPEAAPPAPAIVSTILNTGGQVGPVRRRFEEEVSGLIERLGMSRPDAEHAVRKQYPDMGLAMVKEMQELHDEALGEALNGKAVETSGFMILARQHAATTGVDLADACTAISARYPGLYEGYRKALVGK